MAERAYESDQLRLLLDVNGLTLSKLAYSDFLVALSAAIQPVLGHEQLSVALYDRQAGELRVPMTHAKGLGITRQNVLLPLDRSPEGVTLQRGIASVFRPDDLERLNGGSRAVAVEAAAMCCIPLVTARGLLGVLN